MDDRRRFVRLQTWLTASYSVVGQPPLDSITRNISAGGIGFLTKSRLAPGTLLEIALSFPEPQRTVRFTAEVRWSGPLLLEGGRSPSLTRSFETGVRFVRIAPEDERFLFGYASGH